MSNKFNIHDWQAKQRLNEQPTTDNDWKGLDAEVAKYIASTFATWMSRQSRVGSEFVDNPPFSQEYAKAPYFDKLVEGIMDIVNNYEDLRLEPEDEDGDLGRFDDESIYETDVDEQNVTGTGAAYQGTGMGHFGKKKKRKNDQI